MESQEGGTQKIRHFTEESKQRQMDGARKGGLKGGRGEKHFTPASKEAQREGSRRGGLHSHLATGKKREAYEPTPEEKIFRRERGGDRRG